jgi:hypothetical protein
MPCRNSFDGDNTTYWSYPFNHLYKRVGAPNVTLGADSVGTLLQTGDATLPPMPHDALLRGGLLKTVFMVKEGFWGAAEAL